MRTKRPLQPGKPRIGSGRYRRRLRADVDADEPARRQGAASHSGAQQPEARDAERPFRHSRLGASHRVESNSCARSKLGAISSAASASFLASARSPGEQVAFAEVAMRRGLVGGAGLKRGAELAHRDRRRPASAPAGPSAECAAASNGSSATTRVQRQAIEPIVPSRFGERPPACARPRRWCGRGEQRLVFLDRSRPCRRAFGQLRHQQRAGSRADRVRHQRRGAIERRDTPASPAVASAFPSASCAM